MWKPMQVETHATQTAVEVLPQQTFDLSPLRNPEKAAIAIAVRDGSGTSLSMVRTVKAVRPIWDGIEGEPKSKKSKAHVPVISALRKFLEQHRLRSGNPEAGIMFKTRNNTPVSMNNLVNDQILPVLNACEQCGKLRAEHAVGRWRCWSTAAA